jgi:hypothetical protein
MDAVGNEGTHWCLLSLVDKDYNMYYDSFSVPPPEQVLKFLKQQPKDCLLSPKYIKDQALQSVACGYYCVLMALLQIKRGFTPRQCIDLFQNDVKYNESVISEFAEEVVKTLQGRKLRDS